MSQAKLLKILSTFSKKDWKGLSKYISIHYTEDSDCVILLGLLKNYNAQLDVEDFDDKVHSKHFKSITKKSFSNLLSKLYKVAEDYLVYDQLQKDVNERDLKLIKVLHDRGIYDIADKVADKMHQRLDELKQLDLHISDWRYQLLHQQYFSNNPIKYRMGASLLDDLVGAHNIRYKDFGGFYIAEMHNWGKLQNHDFMNRISTLVKSTENLDDSVHDDLIQLWQVLIKDYKEEVYSKLLEFIDDNSLQVGGELHTLLILHMMQANHYWKNSGIDVHEQMITLVEYAIKNNVVTVGGKLPQIRFHNIIGNLRSTKPDEKSFNRIDAFIDGTISKVETKSLESTALVARAQNCFYHRKYNKILDHLRNAKPEDISQTLRIRILEIIAYYKEREYELASNSNNNLVRYLKRIKKQVSHNTYVSRSNFTKGMHYLIQAKFELLRALLDDGSMVVGTDWFREELK